MSHTLSQVKFYKDGKFLNFSVNNSLLSIKTATVRNSGNYSCSWQMVHLNKPQSQPRSKSKVSCQLEESGGTVRYCSGILEVSGPRTPHSR